MLYIGAGAVAAGGIISLVRSLPLIWAASGTASAIFRRARNGTASTDRRDQDLPMKFVGIGMLVLLAAIMLSPSLHMNLLGALLIVLFGFLFVTVSSRLTGEIGSTSNPISGMTIATLLLTCLVFLLVGWTGGTWYVTALSVGGIVCIASSNGGTTSQDLKTGFLVGATPRLQQIAILIGAFASALLMGPILLKLNDTATVYVPIAQVAPQGLTTDVAALGDARESLTGRRRATTPRATASGTRPISRAGRPANTSSTTAAGPCGWWIRASTARTHAARWHRGAQVRRAEGDAGLLHHQGHPRPRAAVGADALRRDDRDADGDLGRAVAGVRGRRVPADLVDRADLHRRHDPLVRRRATRQGAGSARWTKRNSPRRRIAGPACCSPRATSRAAPSPASSSPSWPACWATSMPRCKVVTANNPFYEGP